MKIEDLKKDLLSWRIRSQNIVYIYEYFYTYISLLTMVIYFKMIFQIKNID